MTKDLLASYMHGLIGNWTLPREIARDYLKQVTAEKRVEQTDPKVASNTSGTKFTKSTTSEIANSWSLWR